LQSTRHLKKQLLGSRLYWTSGNSDVKTQELALNALLVQIMLHTVVTKLPYLCIFIVEYLLAKKLYFAVVLSMEDYTSSGTADQ
jgi:hypothetical protein